MTCVLFRPASSPSASRCWPSVSSSPCSPRPPVSSPSTSSASVPVPPAAPAAARGALMSATVPTAAVKPDRHRGAAHRRRPAARRSLRRDVRSRRGATDARVTSTPAGRRRLRRDRRDLGSTARSSRRTRSPCRSAPGPATTWSAWEDLEYHDEHGPDAGSAEAADRPSRHRADVRRRRRRRPGRGPHRRGATAARRPLPGPGGPGLRHVDRDRGAGGPAAGRGTPRAPYDDDYDAGVRGATATDGITLQAARQRAPPRSPPSTQPRPVGRRREHPQQVAPCATARSAPASCTTRSTPTTTPRPRCPRILRSIYAYHVKSRGWSDIGYNFLVDRFGRIWEGRYGGIDKPVVGAHTLNYNDYAFAMSAIGNFDTVQPPDVMLRAYGQLFAWKLSLHGVNPASTSQQVGRDDVPGDQRPPRRRLDGLPGQVPLRPAPADPDLRQPGRAGGTPPPVPIEVADAEPAEQPRRVAVPGPGRAPRRATVAAW